MYTVETVETWKTVEEAPRYEVSNFGRVRSNVRQEPKVMKQTKLGTGYMKVNIMVDGDSASRLVHRLVCEAFHGACPEDKSQVAHYDGSRDNNHASNLRWTTAKENCSDKVRHGTLARGETSGMSKISSAQVLEIRSKYAAGGVKIETLAASYGLSSSQVWKLITGESWGHLKEGILDTKALRKLRLTNQSNRILSQAQVLEIRAKYARGVKQSALAREYGVGSGNIHCIVRRKTWKHLA